MSDHGKLLESLLMGEGSTAGQKVPPPLTTEQRLANAPVPKAQNQVIRQAAGVPMPSTRGNIDLHSRPVVHNKDGSISTVMSMSFHDDKSGKEVLIPMVVNGRVVDEKSAIDHYYRTGDHLGMFDSPQDADKYAIELHNQQGDEYERPTAQKPPQAPAPAPYVPPPGWSLAPVQADNKTQYLTPAGWHVPGQPEAPMPVAGQAAAGQAVAPNNYVPPQGWTVPQAVQAQQDAAQNQAVAQALQQRFGGGKS